MLALVLGCRSNKEPPPPPPPAPPAAPAAQASKLLELFPQNAPDLGAALAKLEEQRKTASPTEAALLDKAIAVARAYDAAGSDPERIAPALIGTRDFMRELIKTYPDDVDTAVMAISSLQMLSHQIESMERSDVMSPDEVRREALALATALTERAPNSAKAWNQLAHGLPYSDPLAKMRAYARCVKLDPSQVDRCVKPLDDLRTDYQRPACLAADMHADLTWHEARETPFASSRPTGPPRNLHVATTPRFTHAELVRAQADENLTVHVRSDGGRDEMRDPMVRFAVRDLRARRNIATTGCKYHPRCRFQFNLSGLCWATFWSALSMGAWAGILKECPGIEAVLAPFGVIGPCAAIGALLGDAWRGVSVGTVALGIILPLLVLGNF
jgi:hypothetical protein